MVDWGLGMVDWELGIEDGGLGIEDGGLGIEDGGLGIGDWGFGVVAHKAVNVENLQSHPNTYTPTHLHTFPPVQ
jgi:hypothetical protein